MDSNFNATNRRNQTKSRQINNNIISNNNSSSSHNGGSSNSVSNTLGYSMHASYFGAGNGPSNIATNDGTTPYSIFNEGIGEHKFPLRVVNQSLGSRESESISVISRSLTEGSTFFSPTIGQTPRSRCNFDHPLPATSTTSSFGTGFQLGGNNIIGTGGGLDMRSTMTGFDRSDVQSQESVVQSAIHSIAPSTVTSQGQSLHPSPYHQPRQSPPSMSDELCVPFPFPVSFSFHF